MDEGKYKNDVKNLFQVPEFWLVVRGTFIENRKIAIENEMELNRIYKQTLELIISETLDN